ncbi:hypothetical protein [Sphingopyxis sp. MSC1_008]|jgi:hypothetical protein|uniref:hypothetical protein n=1 Tax=Sphingopyxis sp. MSC1_008 TaxID=2909265 RepID=UPI0020BEBAE3|nr:hypothetical protein [Sphingopyxis sp. MSC1_008]
MRAYHLLISSAASAPRRVDFYAESPDHAFQIARNEEDGIDVELWEGERMLARMTKSGANIWKLTGSGSASATYGRGRSGASA